MRRQMANSCMPNGRTEIHQPKLLDLKAAAKYSGLSYWTLYDLATAGLIDVVKIPNVRRPGKYQRRIWFSTHAIDEFITSHETKRK